MSICEERVEGAPVGTSVAAGAGERRVRALSTLHIRGTWLSAILGLTAV